MKSTTVWASRDVDKPKIKVWAQEPTFVHDNGVWTGKDYLGLSCVERWPGPYLEGGEKMFVSMMIVEAL